MAALDLTGITVHGVPINFAGVDKLNGTGDVSMKLAATGGNAHDLVASLNGSGRINFTNGTIERSGLVPLIEMGPAFGDKTIPREIEYRSLSASMTVEQGVLHNDDLKLVGPWLSATGSGALDLGHHEINYLRRPNITGTGGARIAITGA